MPDTVQRSPFRRFWHTPVQDLLRGRVSGRLDPAYHLDRANLPAPAAELVLRVVRRTRLWRIERTDVAAELVAHFADGLDAGTSLHELIAAFGPERDAAKLIRRAKIRNRPMAWHVLRMARRAVLLLLLIYGLLLLRYYAGKPTIGVDYVASLNAPVEKTPIDQRAWPLYAQALIALQQAEAAESTAKQDASDDEDDFRELLATRPNGERWRELVSWLDLRKPTLDLVREAAARPTFGFVLGPNGSQQDAPLNIRDKPADLQSNMLLSTLLPALNHSRTLALMVAADLRLAVEQKDGARAIANLNTLLSLAEQLRNDSQGSFFVAQLVALGIDTLALSEWSAALFRNAGAFEEPMLVAAAHRLSRIGKTSPLIDIRGERKMFYDAIQRIYTDDGAGDGRPTNEGMQMILPSLSNPGHVDKLMGLSSLITAPLGLVGSRREVTQEYDRLMDMAQAQIHRPAREADFSQVHERLDAIQSDPLLRTRYLPITLLMPSLWRATVQVERTLGKRDALLVVHALEIYRRQRQGQYPASLDALVPALLPEVPVDRVAGGRIRYTLIDGKPLIYSVGDDGDDDGGRVGLHRSGHPYEFAAAEWPHLNKAASPPLADGDWVMYPEPAVPPNAK